MVHGHTWGNELDFKKDMDQGSIVIQNLDPRLDQIITLPLHV